MISVQALNIVGLVAGFVGSSILALNSRYEKSEIDKLATGYVGQNPHQVENLTVQNCRTQQGWVLLTIGFLLQLIVQILVMIFE